MMQSIQQWFQMLNTRERIMVLSGAVISVGLLFWGVIWDPMKSDRQLLITQIEDRERELRWMKAGQRQIQAAPAVKSKPKPMGRDISRVLEGQLRRHQLLKGHKMSGTQDVKLTLKKVQADQVMRFLGVLENQQNIYAKNFELKPLDNKGSVDVTLRLSRGK